MLLDGLWAMNSLYLFIIHTLSFNPLLSVKESTLLTSYNPGHSPITQYYELTLENKLHWGVGCGWGAFDLSGGHYCKVLSFMTLFLIQ